MTTFAPALLPDVEKENLCRSLLDEFGIDVIRSMQDELIHACPFGSHKDQQRNPTASLNYHKLTFHCLGCGAKGGLLWFIARLRGEDQNQARQWLSKETGHDGHVMELANLLRFFDALYGEQSKDPEPIPSFSPSVLNPWRIIHPYMTDSPQDGGRGVPESTYLHFQVGYASNYSMGPGQPDSERIIIPHFWEGTLVGWQSRRLFDDGTPKYKNSPNFPKDSTLYNFPSSRDRIVLVESPLSVLRRFDSVPDMSASFGATVTDAQIRLLQSFSTVILWMDNDNAGWSAVSAIGEKLMAHTNVLVVENPYAADPADDLSESTIQALIDSAVPYSVWQPPTSLLCFRCQQPAHQSLCKEVN